MTSGDDADDLPFQQLAQHLPVLCWISDAEGVITWVNDAWLAYTGKDPAALAGGGLFELHDPQVLPEVRRRWALARKAGEAAEMDFPLRGVDGRLRLFHTRVVPLRDSTGRLSRWFGANTDISLQAEAEARARQSEASLAESEERLRLATEAGEVGLWDVDPLSDVLFWPPRVKAMFGISPDAPVSMSKDFFPCLHPDDRDRVAAAYAAAADPEVRALYDVEYRTVGKEDSIVRWVAAKGRGLFDETGRCYRVLGTAVDITARKAGEQAVLREIEARRRIESQQRLLINELNHRVKNTLATVQSIVAQTSRSGRTAEETAAVLESRLLALSAAHDLLTRRNWEGADLRDVAARATAPFAGEGQPRVNLSGPSMMLGPNAALAVSMALHELATNAVKYGALSRPGGAVTIEWRSRGRRFELEWREAGGPTVSPPRSRGFGSRLLESGLARDLRGKVTLEFAPQGVRCCISGSVGSPSARPLELGLSKAASAAAADIGRDPVSSAKAGLD